MVCFSLPSHDQKNTLACYHNACAEPRAMVQISHGMCEYFERYTHFAEYLGECGFLVFGHDHLGHGHTARCPEDLGFTAEGGGAEHLIEDVHTLSLSMKAKYPDLPLILFGHSMGSFIAREVVARYPSDYTATVFCGTGGPETPTGLGKLLVRLLMAFRGERHRSTLIARMAFIGYNKKIKPVRTPCDWLSQDRDLVDGYLKDPLCRYIFTLRAYHDLFSLVGTVSKRDWASRVPTDLPILLISGEMDPVGGWGRGVREVDRRLRAAGHTPTLRLYPEMRHEILNEIGREEVLKEIEQWLKEFQL